MSFLFWDFLIDKPEIYQVWLVTAALCYWVAFCSTNLPKVMVDRDQISKIYESPHLIICTVDNVVPLNITMNPPYIVEIP